MSRNRSPRGIRVGALAILLVCLVPAMAAADWLVTPFLGAKLDGQTNLIDLDQAAGATKPTVGGSVALLGKGILGVEMDVGYTPGFFDSDARGSLVSHSHVLTLTGNLLVTAPISVTRESLRPYLVAGVGAMHAGIADKLAIFRTSSTFVALDVGGGVIGALTKRSSLRLELRRFQNLTEDRSRVVGFGPSRLSFWRATVGLALHY